MSKIEKFGCISFTAREKMVTVLALNAFKEEVHSGELILWRQEAGLREDFRDAEIDVDD